MNKEPKTIRVLVCGGRDYNDPLCVGAWLGAIHKATPISCIIHGAASGADTLAGKFAEWKGIAVAPYPAEWNDIDHPEALVRTRRDGTKYNAKAGPIRNAKMLREGKPDLVVAFPGGNGTADMIRQARAAGVPVKDTSIEPLS